MINTSVLTKPSFSNFSLFICGITYVLSPHTLIISKITIFHFNQILTTSYSQIKYSNQLSYVPVRPPLETLSFLRTLDNIKVS